MSKVEFQVQNNYWLEKLRNDGHEVYDFNGWKMQGKFVKKGQKQKAFAVKTTIQRMDPITGEYMTDYTTRTAYGFTKDQVS